jgi:sRNA-binding protein
VSDPKTLLHCLIELFPLTFTAEEWAPHKPLKIDIGKELVTLGILTAAEVDMALRRYCGRVMYLKSCIAGAPRFGLSGNHAGVVSDSEAKCSAGALTAVMARRAKQAAKAEAERQAAKWRQAIETARRKRLESETKQR